MPVNRFRGGVPVELVSGVDESLDCRGVDMIDGGKVEYYGLEGGTRVMLVLDVTRAGIVPRTVLKYTCQGNESR